MHIYEIRVQGHLDQHWSAWFNGLEISYAASGTTVLRGPLVDEAALHGVLSKVRKSSIALTCRKSRAGRCSGALVKLIVGPIGPRRTSYEYHLFDQFHSPHTGTGNH